MNIGLISFLSRRVFKVKELENNKNPSIMLSTVLEKLIFFASIVRYLAVRGSTLSTKTVTMEATMAIDTIPIVPGSLT